MNVFSVILTLILTATCGTTRTFDNPHDPENKASPSGAKDGGTSSTESGTQSETCLLATCTPPAGTVYDFQSTFNATPAGCGSVLASRMFDTGSGLTLFFDATCGARRHVYALNTSYTGTPSSGSILLTAECITSSGVTSWAIARGITEYMLVYSCQTATSAYQIKSVPVSLSGTPGTSITIESTTSSYSLVAGWNGTANAYGVVRSGLFRRLSTSGAAVGGSIVTASRDPYAMTVLSGNWFFLVGNSSSYCSKINASGTLQCNEVYHYGANKHRFVGSNSTLNYWGELHRNDLDLSSCVLSRAYTASNVVNVPEQYDLYDATSLSLSFSAAAWRSSRSLIVGVAASNASTPIYSEASVADFASTLNTADLEIIQNKIYINYTIDGDVRVSYSTQNVP